jgi:hypothetical protein
LVAKLLVLLCAACGAAIIGLAAMLVPATAATSSFRATARVRGRDKPGDDRRIARRLATSTFSINQIESCAPERRRDLRDCFHVPIVAGQIA